MRPTTLSLLEQWLRYAETDWNSLPGSPQWGFYGTGFNGWGVQTQQKYLAAAALVATESRDEALRSLASRRALAALRWNLANHRSGSATCSDGSRWGHTWISALGIERMMHGVARLRPGFTEADHSALRRVLCSEAGWLLHHYQRGSHPGVQAGRWGSEGKNHPESNLWNGALLWRAAMLCPDHPEAARWQERAHTFFINAVSVPEDAQNATLLAGRTVAERHVGANFFSRYALDHHGYCNVGYMVICVSNAAMLYFDLRNAGLPTPETLHHHQADLWELVRELIFDDGRLIRFGGDGRIRYAYCQDYLLPALLYAAEHLGDPEALARARAVVELFATEARANGDGSFFARRLAGLRRENLFYHTRLESDRACVLAMALAFPTGDVSPLSRPAAPLAAWAEPEYGAAFVKSPRRFASFAWRAHGLAQGLCLPPARGDLAEWEWNLAGYVAFAHHPRTPLRRVEPLRRLERQSVHPFSGGWLTSGCLVEGAEVELQEGWRGADCARHQLALAALPDDRTLLALQFCRTRPDRHTLLHNVKGLHLNLPNDLYNGYERTLQTARGPLVLRAPAQVEETLHTGSRWASVSGHFGVAGLYGAEELVVHRDRAQRGGKLGSLYVDQLLFPHDPTPRTVAPGEVVLDAGWAVLSGTGPQETATFAAAARPLAAGPALRAVEAPGADGALYTLVAHFGPEPAPLPGEIASGNLLLATSGSDGPTLAPGEARLYRRGRTVGPSTQSASSSSVVG